MFNNFCWYDSDLIVHEFPNIQDRKLKVIGQNMERYLQVQWSPNIVLCDSEEFLIFFLDSLVKSLAKIKIQNLFHLHETMRNFYPYATNEMVQLIEQKGVLCYDYIDKFERLVETALPPREQFYNRLACDDYFLADYARAQRVWRD